MNTLSKPKSNAKINHITLREQANKYYFLATACRHPRYQGSVSNAVIFTFNNTSTAAIRKDLEVLYQLIVCRYGLNNKSRYYNLPAIGFLDYRRSHLGHDPQVNTPTPDKGILVLFGRDAKEFAAIQSMQLFLASKFSNLSCQPMTSVGKTLFKGLEKMMTAFAYDRFGAFGRTYNPIVFPLSLGTFNGSCQSKALRTAERKLNQFTARNNRRIQNDKLQRPWKKSSK